MKSLNDGIFRDISTAYFIPLLSVFGLTRLLRTFGNFLLSQSFCGLIEAMKSRDNTTRFRMSHHIFSVSLFGTTTRFVHFANVALVNGHIDDTLANTSARPARFHDGGQNRVYAIRQKKKHKYLVNGSTPIKTCHISTKSDSRWESRYFHVERSGNEQQISDNYLLIIELNAYKSYGNVAADIIWQPMKAPALAKRRGWISYVYFYNKINCWHIISINTVTLNGESWWPR